MFQSVVQAAEKAESESRPSKESKAETQPSASKRAGSVKKVQLSRAFAFFRLRVFIGGYCRDDKGRLLRFYFQKVVPTEDGSGVSSPDGSPTAHASPGLGFGV